MKELVFFDLDYTIAKTYETVRKKIKDNSIIAIFIQTIEYETISILKKKILEDPILTC